MQLDQAKKMAEKLRMDLLPFCERAEIAGSIRRQKPEVKDIEIVVIPKIEKQKDLFGQETGSLSLLESNIGKLVVEWDAYSLKAGQKYKQIVFPSAEIKLDLFIVTHESWGVQFTLRTGPANYSHWLVTQKRYGGALPSFAKIEGGRVLVNGKPIDTPEENDFFKFLGIEMPLPNQRKDPANFSSFPK